MSTELERMLKAAQACGPFRARITAPRFELSNTILAKIRKALEAGGAGTSYAGVFSFTTDVTIAGTLTAGAISAGSVAYAGMTTDDLSVDSSASIQSLRVSGLMRFAGAVSDSASSIATLNVGTLGVSGLSTLAGVVSNSAASLATLNVGTFGVSGLSTLAGVVSDSAVSLANLTVGTLTAATFSPPPTGNLVVASTASIQRLNVADGSFFADIVGNSTASLRTLTVSGDSIFAGIQSSSTVSFGSIRSGGSALIAGGITTQGSSTLRGLSSDSAASLRSLNVVADAQFNTLTATGLSTFAGLQSASSVSFRALDADVLTFRSVVGGDSGVSLSSSLRCSSLVVGATSNLNGLVVLAKGTVSVSTVSVGALNVATDSQFNTLTATGLSTFAGLQSASNASIATLQCSTILVENTSTLAGLRIRGGTVFNSTVNISGLTTAAGIVSSSGMSLARITTNRLRTGYSDVSAAWIPQFDAEAGNFFRYTAISDVSTFSIANSVTGDRVTIVWAQSGGAFKIDVWPTAVLCPETTTPSLATDGRCDVLAFLKINSTPDQWVFAQSGWYDN